MEIFFNGIGYEVKFMVEGHHYKSLKTVGNSAGGSKFQDKYGDNDDTDQGKNKGPKEKDSAGGDKFTGYSEVSQGDSQEDSMEDLIRDGSPGNANHKENDSVEFPDDTPPNITVLPTNVEAVSTERGIPREAPQQPVEEVQQAGCDKGDGLLHATAIIPDEKILVHNDQGTYLLEASKWPILNVESDSVGEELLTQEEDLMELSEHNMKATQVGDSAKEDSSQEWISPISKKKKIQKDRKRRVVVATRASSRIPRDGIPIAEKAMQRAKEKDSIPTEMVAASEAE